MNDEEVVAERRQLDERAFLIKALDPENAPRLSPALLAVRGHLADGRWHSLISTLAAGIQASDIAVKTTENLIRRAAKAGFLEWRGEYRRAWRGRKSQDSRQVRLIEWPDPEVVASGE